MTRYELETLDLPRFEGRSLLTAASILESRVGSSLFARRLLKQGGIDKLRAWNLTEAPTFFPLVPPSGAFPRSHDNPHATPIDFPFETAAALAQAYRAGRALPSTIARAAIAAVANSQKGQLPLCAFIALDAGDVLEQADAADDRLRAGMAKGPLDGVPIAIKDELDMIPYKTTGGTSLPVQPATTDATVVARLRAAGAVLFGKTNMHEIGINPSGQNVHHGMVRNPYDRRRDSGGSSSGSAAAVSAGLCPLAIGCDGGGSIRIPAALCGVVGLKATFGRISEHGAMPICWSVAHVGPLGHSVADVEELYLTIAGPDPLDANTALQPPPIRSASSDDLSDLRIGVFSPWFNHAEPDIVAESRKALAVLQSRGATVVEVEVPYLNELRIAHAVTILGEMCAAVAHHGGRAPTVRLNLALGRLFRADDYVRAQQMRTRALRAVQALFQTVDLIMTPTTAITAPLIPKNALPHGWSDLNITTELMRFAVPANMLGFPALSVPVGNDRAGLPIGAQFMANHWREDLLFRAAYALEQKITPRPHQEYRTLLSAAAHA